MASGLNDRTAKKSGINATKIHGILEARAGIEPAYKDLQSSA